MTTMIGGMDAIALGIRYVSGHEQMLLAKGMRPDGPVRHEGAVGVGKAAGSVVVVTAVAAIPRRMRLPVVLIM